jgi:hypothetical protein
VVGVIGAFYTITKDANDAKDRDLQEAHHAALQQEQLEQQKLANFGALLPLLKSKEESDHQLAFQIFTAEADARQAPLTLLPVIEAMKVPAALQTVAAQAVNAGKEQQAGQCKAKEGVYIHVQEKSQKAGAEKLGQDLKSAGFSYQSVQLVDAAPRRTEIRYYPGASPAGEVEKISALLQSHGLNDVRSNDISYLLHGCPPKQIYEIWIAADAKVGSN